MKKRFSKSLPVRNFKASGIDIGDTFHEVAINDEYGGFEVREFESFTEDLEKLVQWLKDEGITTVAMESTGIYWLNLYLLLEESGIEPYLVNAKHVKNVTGRKKDDTDAIWLQKLHSCGLLQKCFQPDEEIRRLRTFMRHRRKLILRGSDCVRQMQKAMELMNIKLHTVISDILGKTGLLIVNAILDGVRNPDELVKLKDGRIKASDEVIKKSLAGIWNEEYLFLLEQAYEGYQFYQTQLHACEGKIQAQLMSQTAKVLEGDVSEIKLEFKKKPQKNQFSFYARDMLKVIVGVDICEVEGMNEVNSVELISEIGTDMNKWPDSKHIVAWLNLSPNTKITGGRIISSKMEKKKNHAGQTLRMAASTLTTGKTPMSDYARKMRARLGKKGGVVATAHKLARIIYTMIKQQQEYNSTTILDTQEKWRHLRVKYLEKQLASLKQTG